MRASHPGEYYPELTDDKLRAIADRLLDLRHTTLRELISEFDDNYTREATVFGRQKNMLIDLARRGKYDWLSLKHAGMDVTFEIGRVPCRFFTDDPRRPEKSGFFKRNAVDDLFVTDDAEPVLWRFIVEKGQSIDDEDRVHFIGYNIYQEPVAEWTYGSGGKLLHAVDRHVPPTVDIGPAAVELLDDEPIADTNGNKTGTDV